MSGARFYVGLFLITASSLILQVVQTRILSVVAWYHLAFFVVSIAMFGLTAGAVWVYLRKERFSAETLSYDLGYYSALYAITAAIGVPIQLTLATTASFSLTGLLVWAELAACIALPFFFAGVVVSIALTRSPFPIGRVYGVDLVGASVGCLGALALLGLTDGPSVVLWVAALGAGGAAMFATSGIGGAPAVTPPLGKLLSRPARLAVVLGAVALLNGLTVHGFQPILVKDNIETRAGSLLFEDWNSFSRVTVRNKPASAPILWGASSQMPEMRVDQRLMNIDGSAGTPMYRFNGDIEQVSFLKYDVTNLGYFVPGRSSAAVIGVGGGRDVLSARVFGIKDITGVEVNPIFIDLLTENKNFAKFAGIAALPGVNLVVDEGRSWFARTERQFDIVQMSMIDTWAATGAGAFTLSENGLYTLEGWRIFMDRLTPQGIFTVSRWHAEGDINETGRMISLATATLLQMGAADPRQHIFVASAGHIATLVLARNPLSAADLEALRAAVTTYGYKTLIDPKEVPQSEVLARILSAKTLDGLQSSMSEYELDLTAPTDHRPFFFNQLRFDQPLRMIDVAKRRSDSPGVVRGNVIAGLALLGSLLISLVFVVTTIVLPLRGAVRNAGKRLVVAGTSYFVLIGLGFMAVEMSLLQRMSVFLGHPVYSLSIVLFSLILATGIGSLLSDLVPLRTPARFAVWAVVLAAYLLTMPLWISDVLLSLDSAPLLWRAGVTVAVILPAGVLMGFGFPTGMMLVSARDERPTPWFWGINGAAGVLAGGVSVAASLAFGISASQIFGGVCYLALVPAAYALRLQARSVSSEEPRREASVSMAS